MCEVPFSQMKNGTYLAETTQNGVTQKMTFRWESAHAGTDHLHLFSADFHENGLLIASVRGKLDADAWPCGELTAKRYHRDPEAEDPQVVLDIHATGESTLEIRCQLSPDHPSWEGVLTYQGPYFRKLLVRLIRMQEIELPEPLQRHDFPLPLRADISDEEAFETSLEHLFSRMDIQLDVEIDTLEESLLPFDMNAYRHCPEQILWDEKALHQLMLDQLPEMDAQADWTANLLLLRGYYGTYGQFDIGNRETFSRTVGVMFDRQSGFQLSNPGLEHFFNARPRQGAAIFWDPLISRSQKKDDWYLQLEFAFLMVHEIGHILNLRHAPDCMELTYMNYPDRFCGGRDEFWKQFGFLFTTRERAHLNHGFLPEIQPGGAVGFPLIQRPQQKAPQALGARLYLKMTKPVFAYQEPITLEITIRNESPSPIQVPPLDPSYGDLHLHIFGPDKTVREFQPPLVKCLVEKEVLHPGEFFSHTALISVDTTGFWLETPGPYSVQAIAYPGLVDDPVLEATTSFFREEPHLADPKSHRVFENPHAAYFLYYNGANLQGAKEDWLDFLEAFPGHPLSGLAHQALAFCEMPICHKHPKPVKYPALTPTAIEHFKQAIENGELPLSNRRALIEIYDPATASDRKGRGFFAKLKSWRYKLAKLFKKPGFQKFTGTHHFKIKIGGERSKPVDAMLIVKADPKEKNAVTYQFECPDRPHHNHSGSGQFVKGNRFEDPYVSLRGMSVESANEFDFVLRFAVTIFSSKLFLSGKIRVGGGGGATNTPITGSSGTQNPPDPDSSGG